MIKIWFYDEGSDQGGYLQGDFATPLDAKVAVDAAQAEVDEGAGTPKRVLTYFTDRGLEVTEYSYDFNGTRAIASYTLIPQD